MAGNKPNAFLAKLNAQKEAEQRRQLQQYGELDTISMLIAAHNELKVGPGRASFLLAEYTDVKNADSQGHPGRHR